MKIHALIIAGLISIWFPTAVSFGQTATRTPGLQERIEAITEGDVLKDAVAGICARTGDGRVLVDINASDLMVPASNMKLISTGAALHALGGDYRYETKLGYDGSIIEGVLMGDLYIIGGGDPTIASKDTIAIPIGQTFAQWEKAIRNAGIREIDGRVIGTSGNFFSGMTEEPTWLWNDIGTYYGAGATGLMFYENMQSFEVSAGPAPGSALNIRPSYPEAPWMEFRYDCMTGKSGTGDLLYMYTSDLAPVAEVRGTFAVDRKPKRVDCSNKFQELTCAHYFTDWLREHGIHCTQEASDDRLRKTVIPDSLTIVGGTKSPTLKRIVYRTNHASNNLYAEALLKTLGKELKTEGSYDSSYVAVRNVL